MPNVFFKTYGLKVPCTVQLILCEFLHNAILLRVSGSYGQGCHIFWP
ncbi:hypothetical protein DSUL_20123 [Desulfovibrionales bacterium]